MTKLTPEQLDDLRYGAGPGPATLDDMSNPGAKLFGHVNVRVEVWIDPARSDAALDAVLDNVEISTYKAVEAAMKEIEAPDHGVEVVVR